MAILSANQQSRLLCLIDQREKGSVGKYIGEHAVYVVNDVFRNFDGLGCLLGPALKDEPYVALLGLILYVDRGVLSDADRAKLLCTITRMRQGCTGGGQRIDEKTAYELNAIFAGLCGFECSGCVGPFSYGIQHSPFSTLLRILLCVDAGLVPVDVAGGVVIGVPGPAGPLPFVPGEQGCEGLWLFSVLGGSTVTNTGPTDIEGELGLSPGTSVTGFPPGVVVGGQHVTDAVAAAAQVALTAAYLDLKGRTGAAVVAGDIGGQTLAPGLYKSTSSLAVATNNLTLDAGGDANAIWIFQIASTFNLGNARSIILAGGAQAKNIFWQVGSSATLGTTSVMEGSILALVSITVNTGATVNGRVLARNGAVTLDSNDINDPGC